VTAGAQTARFLRACRREAVDTTPVWLMRQAGRYMAEYRALKERYSILDMVKNPEVAAEVTMQPIRAFDVDAAIVFADILTALEALGFRVKFVAGEGPVIENPVRSAEAIRKLDARDPREAVAYTIEAVRVVKPMLGGRVPLIGFSGSPFTLACYAIEGGSAKEYAEARAFMFAEPAAFHDLLDRLAAMVAAYLCAQAEAGADALQLFDSWAGVLSPAAYREFALPRVAGIFKAVRSRHAVPLIYFSTGTAGCLPSLKETGADVISLDWRIDLGHARRELGSGLAVQGNLDPTVLFAPAAAVEREALRVLRSAGGEPGYIFNLGHGVLQHTPVDNVKRLVDFVHGSGVRAGAPA
jgi:uroporphyrinogen decarboxylase